MFLTVEMVSSELLLIYAVLICFHLWIINARLVANRKPFIFSDVFQGINTGHTYRYSYTDEY